MINIKQQALTDSLKKQIYQGFSRHAIAAIGYDEKNENVAFVASDEDNLIGAIVVEIFWGAMHIKYVFVDENHRRKKIGSRLLEEAFAFAKTHHCPFAYVETMSFQALDFYQKFGFKLELTRTGYAHGTSFHYLRKDF